MSSINEGTDTEDQEDVEDAFRLADKEHIKSLHYATELCEFACLSDIPKLKLILDHGRNDPDLSTNSRNVVNVGDYDQRTALHVASSEGLLDVVRFLINEGANVNAQDRWGGTPLSDAIRQQHEEIVKYLIEKGASKPECGIGVANLLKAAALGDLEMVKSVLEADPKIVNSGDWDLRTALHLASSEGHLIVVKYLYSKGAAINAMDRFGGTPLSDAIRAKHGQVAQFLRTYGGKITEPKIHSYEKLVVAFLAKLASEKKWKSSYMKEMGTILDTMMREYPGQFPSLLDELPKDQSIAVKASLNSLHPSITLSGIVNAADQYLISLADNI